MAQSTSRSKSGSSGSGGGSKGSGGGSGGDEEFPEANGTGAADGDVGTAFVDGATFTARAVQYVVVDGLAMLEGDICLGAVEDVQAQTDMRRAELTNPDPMAAAVLVTGANVRWPDCRVPYQVSPDLTNAQRVTDAIAHWESRTRFRFVPRTPANAAQFPDWADFVPSTGCSSFVGRRGGRQEVRLAPACTLGNTIHEIGHLVGLWHEQSREDRDSFVRIEFANIEPAAVHNFNQHISDGADHGPYDYGSIMHYPRQAFSKNGLDTVVPLTSGVTIGQRTGLSAGDIAAVNSLCPLVKHPKEIVKELAKELPDEVVKRTFKDSVKDPIKDRPKEFTKEILKDAIKDTRKDVVKELPKELALDPQKRFGGELVTRIDKLVNPVVTPVGPFLTRGATRQPFVLATGQEAYEAGWQAGQAQAQAQAGQPGQGGELDQLLQALAEYTRLDALGVLGPDDRAAWQQTATYAQQLLGGAGQ